MPRLGGSIVIQSEAYFSHLAKFRWRQKTPGDTLFNTMVLRLRSMLWTAARVAALTMALTIRRSDAEQPAETARRAIGAPGNLASAPGASLRGVTRTFRYEQRRYVYSRQGAGSLAYVPEGAPADAPLPLVVFLHGLNPEEVLHPGFDGSQADLRRVVDVLMQEGKTAPFVLAAPSHTRLAVGTKFLWHDFDLAAFAQETQRALRGVAEVRTNDIILIGHSGAGCNASGSLLGAHQNVRGRIAVDTCLDDEVQARLVSLSDHERISVYYQASWPRPFSRFATRCSSASRCQAQELSDFGRDPHREILPRTLALALPDWLPAAPRAEAPLATR
jgi:hypothetical protein